MRPDKNSSHRPWHGTFLSLVSGIGVLLLVFLLGGLLFDMPFLVPYLEDTPFALLLTTGKFVILYMMTAAILLSSYITIGYFKGQIWAVIISILFTGMSLVEAAFALSYYAVLIYLCLLILEILCIRHPYYNK